MNYSLIRQFISLFLLCISLWACTDHQPGPLAPSRVRLKTTNGTTNSPFPGITEYTYDQQNRLIASSRQDGSRRSFTYDQQNRYQQSDYTPNSSSPNVFQRTKFIYNPNSHDFTAETYLVQNGTETLSLRSSYTFDANNHLIQVRKTDPAGNTLRFFRYEYTGDNITTEQVGEGGSPGLGGRLPLYYFYTYDNKPNPYYGLVAPESDLTEADNHAAVRRHSRNNVITSTFTTDTLFSQYVYNSQGLPTSVTDLRGDGSLFSQHTFTYEPY